MNEYYTALITPFNKHRALDKSTLIKLLHFQHLSTIDGLVILGTTGETSSLTLEEKKTIIELSKSHFKRKIIIGIAENDVNKVLNSMKEFDKYNPRAYLICNPTYNIGTSIGVKKFYYNIAENSKHPIIIYSVPSRGAREIDLEHLEALSKHPNIIGIKNSVKDPFYQLRLHRIASTNFKIYSGNDERIFTDLCYGYDGAISVLSNIMPSYLNIVDQLFAIDINKSRDMFFKILPLLNYLSSEINPVPIKSLMAKLGDVKNIYRLPLDKLPHQKALKELINQNKELFNEYIAYWKR